MEFTNNNLLPYINKNVFPFLDTYISKFSSWIINVNRTQLASIVGTFFVCYLATVRHYRYQYINELRRKYPDPNIALKNSQVAAEVFDITFRREFPALHHHGFELALLRSVTIPSISKLLIATGEAFHRPQKREEDSYLILHEMLDVHPHVEFLREKNPKMTQNEVALQTFRRDHSIARLNEIHARYPTIKHGDFLFQLVLFVNEPIFWINKFGYRKLDQLEINALYKMWSDIAKEMNLTDVPQSAEEMIEYTKKYSEEFAKFHVACQKISDRNINNVVSHNAPSWLHDFVRKTYSCRLTPTDCAATGLPQAPQWMQAIYNSYWYIHGFYIRYFAFPAKHSYLGTAILPTEDNVLMPQYYEKGHSHPTYPNGYTFTELGPAKIKSNLCPMPHMRASTCPVAHHVD
ncbi:hypothetical protein INT45_001882 [Circinella minor]|uniref:ER-bound oxygenase mpaB/mpaB'/Rubber oxygenase catalytic domain-containing protein n=1 Tax=Circinella minor TaxID=1195481 RepID=A0A8H7VKN1_9FUNG|nr:hypothetical protein INT45_001882 [Circinella minor]